MGDHIKTASALIFLALLASASIGQDQARGWAWAGIAASTLENQSSPAPAPAPAPKPGDICPACNGSGKVGDGRIFTTCLDCNGTGKISKAVGVLQGVVGQILGSSDCPDGRCDLLKPKAAALPSPQVQLPSSPCPGGVCPTPSSSQRVYRPPQPQTMRRGWIFRR